MMRFAFFSIPQHGHVNPTLPLVRELQARGHAVTYYLTEDFAQAIRESGADFRSLGDFDVDAEADKVLGGRRRVRGVDLAAGVTVLLRFVARMLRATPGIADRIEAEPPDVIVYDTFALWGRAVAARTGIPSASLSTTYASTPGSTLSREMGAGLVRHLTPRLLVAAAGAAAAAITLWVRERSHGVPLLTPADLLSAGAPLNLVTVPRALQPEADRLDGRFLFVGPTITDQERPARPGQSGHEVLDLLDRAHRAGHRTLLISLGSTPLGEQHDVLRACMTAFADSDWQVHVVAGAADAVIARNAPDNVRVHRWVPQLAVLARGVDAFVTHGGMGSTLEALWFRVPLVVIPFQPETTLTAGRISQLGLGLTLSSDGVHPATVRTVVEAVAATPLIQDRIRMFAEQLRHDDGARRAADALETLAGQERHDKRVP